MQYAVNVPAGAWLAGLLCSYRPAAEGIETLLSAHNVGFWRRPIIQVTTRGPAEGELPIAVNTWGRQQVSESGATAARSEHQGRGDFASCRRRSGVLECFRLVKLPPVGRSHCSGPPESWTPVAACPVGDRSALHPLRTRIRAATQGGRHSIHRPTIRSCEVRCRWDHA